MEFARQQKPRQSSRHPFYTLAALPFTRDTLSRDLKRLSEALNLLPFNRQARIGPAATLSQGVPLPGLFRSATQRQTLPRLV